MTSHPFYMEDFYRKKRKKIPMLEDELLQKLFLATYTMRIAQKKYFKHRNSVDLEKAKDAEFYVDTILYELNE